MNGFLTFLGAIALMVLILFISGWFVEIAWNHVMPYLFGLRKIDWLQGVALSYLAGLLAGSTRAVHNTARGE